MPAFQILGLQNLDICYPKHCSVCTCLSACNCRKRAIADLLSWDSNWEAKLAFALINYPYSSKDFKILLLRFMIMAHSEILIFLPGSRAERLGHSEKRLVSTFQGCRKFCFGENIIWTCTRRCSQWGPCQTPRGISLNKSFSQTHINSCLTPGKKGHRSKSITQTNLSKESSCNL